MNHAKYRDMNKHTGEPLTDNAQLSQSIHDILLTPIGSRVMRRRYGSALFALVDQPNNPALQLQIIAAACIAIYQWEPRLTPTQITLSATHNGQRLTVIGHTKDTTNFTTEVAL